MNILFLGGDKRYKLMMEELSKKTNIYQVGFNFKNAVDVNSLDLSKFDIVVLPISGISDNLEVKSETGLIKLPENLFKNLDNHIKFFTGLKTNKILELIPVSQLTSFLDFDEVQKRNNFLTIDRCYGRYKK